MAQQIIQDVDARHNTHTNAGRDVHNYYYTSACERGPSRQPPQSLSLNDAPDVLSTHFTGRGEELDHMGNALGIVYGNAPTRYAIFGMAGLGKTQLALQYATLSYNQQRYSVVFWISGATVDKLNQGLARILALVGHPDRDHPEQSIRLSSARRWLEESGSIRWLLILDNIVQEVVGFLGEHLPRKNSSGNILLTTQAAPVAEAVTVVAGRQHQILDLQAPNLGDAAKQFLKEAEIDTNTSMHSSMSKAEDLVKRFGRIPLTISNVASFTKQSGKNLDEVLSIYQSKHKYELMSWKNSPSQKSFVVTIITQLQELDRQSPDSNNLLKVLSFFDPESIPLHMINEGAEDLQLRCAPDSSSPHIIVSSELESLIALLRSPVLLPQAIQPLRHLSLVRCESSQGTSTLRIHDSIQFVIQEIARKDDCWFHVAVGLAYGAFRRVSDPASHKCWAQCETLSPHIQSLSKLDGHATANSELDRMNIGIAQYLTSRGRYSEAEVLFRQALAGTTTLHGLEHPDTLRIAEELGMVYWRQGRYTEAQVLFEQTLASRRKNLGSEHLDTLRTVHNLALAYQSQGRYTEAEMLFEKAFAGREKGLGPEHPDTLGTIHYMALTYRYQARISEAETLYCRALTGREKVLGLDHQDTLKTMNNLATVYQSQGRSEEAETMHLCALAAKEKLLGRDHPSTLVTVDSLALTKISQGQCIAAEKLFGRALADREKVLGAEHPDTLKTVQNLAVTYELQERYDEAMILYRRALAGRETVLGHDHPHTLETVQSLADFFKKQSILLQNRFPCCGGACDFAATAKVTAKKQLHEQADAEMSNASKPGLSIQSLIDKAVLQHLKHTPPKNRGAKKNHNGKKGKKMMMPTPKKALVKPKPSQPKAGHCLPHATKMGPKPKSKGKGKGKKSA